MTMLPRRHRARTGSAALATLCALALLVYAAPRAGALAVRDTPAPVTGNATYFDALGSPYGGCGLPQTELDSPHFVALNVYDTPGDYAFYPRPIPADQAAKIGMWDNGHNCGRFVRVAIADFCTGINDGAPGQPFCRNGSWVADAYNGATLTMVVADSCGDANAWCRDDPYHLDLAKASLNQFVKNGAPVGDLLPDHFNNRHVTWQFVPAPNYTGDIRIGFLSGAQRWWPAIAVSHLANGIHGVEYLTGSGWQAAQMNGDLGQSFIIGGTTSGGTDFAIRVRDVTGALVNNGRVYRFSLPASCGSQCGPAYTPVSYTTDTGGPTTSPTATATPTATTTPTATATPTVTATAQPGRACSATYTTTGQWGGGYQAEVTVRNTGSQPLTGWRATWTLPAGQTVNQIWNGTAATSGSTVTVTNASYNGALGPGGTATFGFTGGSTGTPVTPVVTCAGT